MDVQSLVDATAFAHADAALALHDAVGDESPEIDLDDGYATFVDSPGRLSFAVQVIGLEHPSGGREGASPATGLDAMFGLDPRGEWEWAWARSDLFPPHLLGLANRVRETGERYDLAELVEPRLPLGTLSAAHFVIAAKTIAGCVASITVPGPDGARVHLMIDLRGQTPGTRQASTAISTALRQGLVADHGRALDAYARIADMPVREIDGGVELAARDGRLEIGLDEHARIVRLAIRDQPEADDSVRTSMPHLVELGSMPRLTPPRVARAQ